MSDAADATGYERSYVAVTHGPLHHRPHVIGYLHVFPPSGIVAAYLLGQNRFPPVNGKGTKRARSCTRPPSRQQRQEIRYTHHPVSVEIRWAAGVGAPQIEQGG